MSWTRLHVRSKRTQLRHGRFSSHCDKVSGELAYLTGLNLPGGGGGGFQLTLTCRSLQRVQPLRDFLWPSRLETVRGFGGWAFGSLRVSLISLPEMDRENERKGKCSSFEENGFLGIAFGWDGKYDRIWSWPMR